MEFDDGSENILGERPIPERFEYFDLALERGHERYRVRVRASPLGPKPPMVVDPQALEAAGGGQSPPEIKLGSAAVDSSTGGRQRDIRRPRTDRNLLQKQGEKLFRAVFTGDVGTCFRTSLERQRAAGQGLLLRLHFDEAPELAALPWEALWDPTERAFLADLPDLPIARGLTVVPEAAMVAAAEPPLQVVALLPQPAGEPEIAGVEEWQQIQGHLEDLIGNGQVVADQVVPATLKALGQRMKRAPCDVLHVVAHGSAGGADTTGQLRLEDRSGRADYVSGGDLTRALERRKPPRLVVLSACHGATSSADDAFDGLAQHLLSRGVPAVVAMSYAITDDAAVAFAASLYRELASGRTIEMAVVEARRELSLGGHRAEWATPVLYLRGANIRLFDTLAIPHLANTLAAEKSRTPSVLKALAGLATLGLIALGIFYFARPGGDARCAPVPGLEDLEFVEIRSGVVNLEGRDIVVEKPFCLATKEITRRDWQVVMLPDKMPRPHRKGDHPMTDITLDDARAFATRLGERDPGHVYRLPDADEWEYAARAGAATKFFYGEEETELAEYGNCRTSFDQDGYDDVAPVGNYPPNAWGLYDVHGNVAEWVEWPQRDEGDSAGLEGLEISAEGTLEKLDERKGYTVALSLGGSFTHVPRNCAFGASWREIKKDISTREETGFRVAREIGERPRE